jgi:outer membrane protein assembly factor BamA
MRRMIGIILGLAFVLSFSSQSSAVDRRKLRWVRNSPIIDSIVVEGNHYFSDGDIKKQMYSKERSFLGWLKGDRRTRVQRESLGRDTLEIKYMYLLEGFFDISVTEEFEVLEPDRPP